MRSTLKTRGAQAFSVAYMSFPPEVVGPDSIALRLQGKGLRLKKYRRRFAKQHRNNAVGTVFTANARARSVKARPKDATSEKGREIVPALISRIQNALLAPLDLGDLVGLGAAGGYDF